MYGLSLDKCRCDRSPSSQTFYLLLLTFYLTSSNLYSLTKKTTIPTYQQFLPHMIRLADIDDVVEITDLVDTIITDFEPIQRLMRERIRPLARGIKKQWRPFPAAHIKARVLATDTPFAISSTIENEWHDSEYLKIPRVPKGKTAFVEQAASLIFAGKSSETHKQGIRLLATNLPRELSDCLHYSGRLLFADVLHAPDKDRLDTPAFSPFHRFWHGNILLEQGVPGVTIAFMLWRRYLESIVPTNLREEIYQKMQRAGAKITDPLQLVLDTFLDTATREQIENDLLLLGKLFYRTDFDQEAISYLVQKAVIDRLEPYLWGALATFGPQEMTEKIKSSKVIAADTKTDNGEALLTLVMLFNELDWAKIDQILGVGSSVRKIVGSVLNKSPQLVRMDTSRHQVSQTLLQAQTHGLLPIAFPEDNVGHYHPVAAMNNIDRAVRRIAHQG